MMAGKTDIVKGRLEEAAGALTGNDKLRKKGRANQAVGKVKQVVAEFVEETAKILRK